MVAFEEKWQLQLVYATSFLLQVTILLYIKAIVVVVSVCPGPETQIPKIPKKK
jgi:hypothetical protein